MYNMFVQFNFQQGEAYATIRSWRQFTDRLRAVSLFS